MPVLEYLGHIDHVERSPRHRPPAFRRDATLHFSDGQVHHDTHPIPMGNYVIAVGNYLIAKFSQLGNYKIADTHASAYWSARPSTFPPVICSGLT